MEIFLIKALQLILSLSLLVLLHEGGHFFFSKLFGVRVNKFYIFFDWKFSLFKKKVGETEYGIGWIPLGGYCQIEGMVDETQHDLDKLKEPAKPWEFRSKPAWQRLLIMIGGVLVNFLLALFIYSMVLFAWGEQYVATKDMKYGMKFSEQAKALGFKDGDKLLAHDQGEFKVFDTDVFRTISSAQWVLVERNGKEVKVNLPGDLNMLDMIKTEPMFVRPLLPADVDSVMPGSPAQKAGMKAGDKILALGGKKVDSWNEMNYETGRISDMLAAATSSADSLKARTTTIVFKHKGSATADTATVVLTPDIKLGVTLPTVASFSKITEVKYGFFESFPAGIRYGLNILSGYVGDLKYVFTADGAKSMGGFGTIGSLFPDQWDWLRFWNMTAFLSIILAFMNILPIPALDGGHVLFLLYEMITRRKPSDKFLIYAEYFGFGLLVLLMIFANLNDVLRALGLM